MVTMKGSMLSVAVRENRAIDINCLKIMSKVTFREDLKEGKRKRKRRKQEENRSWILTQTWLGLELDLMDGWMDGWMDAHTSD